MFHIQELAITYISGSLFISFVNSSCNLMEETIFGSAEKRYAVVTGANKGIGFEICRQLASNGVMVILTARNEDRGAKAVETLKESGLSNVFFHQLDIKDPTSIAALVSFIESQFKKIDILVNNAAENGVILDVEGFKAYVVECKGMIDANPEKLSQLTVEPYEMAEECLKTNYYGTKAVTEAILPFLQLSDSPRIVNISSIGGQLNVFSNEKVKAELNNVDCLIEERIDELLQRFLKDFKENMLKANGWPLVPSAYRVSKAALNAYTRILARKLPSFRINCVHPGFVETDMSHHTGALNAEQGAKAPVMLALLPQDGPSGCYFDQMEMSTF